MDEHAPIRAIAVIGAGYVGLTTALCLGGCAVGLALGRLLVEGRGGW